VRRLTRAAHPSVADCSISHPRMSGFSCVAVAPINSLDQKKCSREEPICRQEADQGRMSYGLPNAFSRSLPMWIRPVRHHRTAAARALLPLRDVQTCDWWPFAVLAWVARESLRWTSHGPAIRRSSPIAERGFCPECGTPLFLSYDGRDDIALTVGTLDDAACWAPTSHYGIESRLPWTDCGPGNARGQDQGELLIRVGHVICFGNAERDFTLN
jgi:hypothetical protein